MARDEDRTLPQGPSAQGQTRKLGPMPVLEELGRGGMGAVLRVRDPALERSVAAKVAHGALDPAQQAKFLREARLTGQLTHPNIVPVYALARAAGGELFFTMQEVHGQDLASTLTERRRRPRRHPLGRLVQVFLKICEAMAYAHDRGVIHRDLKPANVMTGPFGEVLVMDWGLAKQLGQDDLVADGLELDRGLDGDHLQTLDGTILGTPSYMPPEQAEGQVQTLDQRADIYALGAILYEILTTEAPYVGKSALAILDQIGQGPPPPPRERNPEAEIPAELEAICAKAMARNPDDRYGSVDELREDVLAYLEGRLVGVAEYTLAQRVRRTLQRHRLPAAVLAAVMLTALIVGIWSALEARAELGRRQRALAALGPHDRIERARYARETVPESVRDQRLLPSPSLSTALAAEIRGLREVAAAAAAVRELGKNEDLRQLEGRAWLEVARLAQIAGEYSTAELAINQASGLLALQAASEREAMKQRLADRDRARRETTDELLAQAAKGQLDDWRYRDAVALLASYRDPESVQRLVAELDRISAKLADLYVEGYATAEQPTAEERANGEGPLRGLTAVARWRADGLRKLPDAAPRPNPERMALLNQGIERISRRTGKAGIRWLTRRLTLSFEDPRTGGAQRIGLICDALAAVGPERASCEALYRFIQSDLQPNRVVSAGRALARLASRDEYARTLLTHVIAGTYHPWRRWTEESWWWLTARNAFDVGASAKPSAGDGTAALRARAKVLIEGGEPAKALELLDQAYEQGDRSAVIYSQLAFALRGLGQLERALKISAEGCERYPKSRALIGLHGDLLFGAGRAAEALEVARRLGRASTTPWAPGLRLEVMALRELGRAQAAKAAVDRLLELSETPQHLGLRASIYLEAKQYQLAADDATKAIGIDPGHAQSYWTRGVALARMKRPRDALSDLDKAIRLDPESSRFYYSRALVNQQLGNTDRALDDYSAAIHADGTNYKALVNRGMLRARSGELDKGLIDFESAARAAPKAHRGQVHLARASVLFEAARHPEAAAAAKQGTQLSPGSFTGWWLRYQIAAKTNDVPEMRAALRKALPLAPANNKAWIRQRLAQLGG